MLKHRLLLGPILIALVLAFAWLDQFVDTIAISGTLSTIFGDRSTLPPGMIIFIPVSISCLLAAWELARILRDNNIRASTTMTCIAAIAGLLVTSLVPSTENGVSAVAISSTTAGLLLIAGLLFHTRNENLEGVVSAAGGLLLSFVYLGLLWGLILALRRQTSAWFLIWVLLSIKFCDIGAYFTGRTIGKHKLIAWISPGKTWEGLIGGVITSAVVGSVGLWCLIQLTDYTHAYPWVAGALAGAVLGLVGQGGDLIASMFKRDAGLKDASRVLPGFGGMLDVLDSLVIAFPVAYWLHAWSLV